MSVSIRAVSAQYQKKAGRSDLTEVNIIADGKKIKAFREMTLLDNLLCNGFDVPHLCHNKELEAYGGCGLCIVEVEGSRKPLRACSVTVSEGMCVTTKSEALEKSREATLSFLCSDHSGDCKAPCFYACPTHHDVQGYVGLIANGKTKEALEIIMRDNPLPSSIGRVCPHPCEKKCRRSFVDEPVSICALKRFAADEENVVLAKKEDTFKRIAVVGGGPAGISCAYFSALSGHRVEIFEAKDNCGGMLRYGIPEYRLPKSVLNKEIDAVLKLGVKVHYNKMLGRDFSVADLKNEFDAVFIGTGAQKSGSLRCENDGADGVLGGIDFLYDVAVGKLKTLSGKIAVVGGGNTAIDAARTAVRLGASEVTIIYRRTENEMPAEKLEIKEAKEEGVSFRFLETPLSVVLNGEKAAGLVLQKMKQGEPDSSGRRASVPIEGATETVSFDLIISAVGQLVKNDGLSGIELTKKGTVSVDESTYMTSLDGVFAAGDVINKGPDIAIRAIAGGKNAAKAIDAYLAGEKIDIKMPLFSENRDFDPNSLSQEVKKARTEQSVLPPDVRKADFSESTKTFTKEEALKEASRCLECGCSAVYECKLLPLMREYGSLSSPKSGKKHKAEKDKSNPFIIRDSGKCILCALCVRSCREISKTETLGLFGRGFDTLPETAFFEPLLKSSCISCGVCAAVCPTGALSLKTPGIKNVPLEFFDEHTVCGLCKRKCGFIKRTSGGRVTLLPDDLRKHCSYGMFLPVLKAAKSLNISEESLKEASEKLFSDMEYFAGNKESVMSFEIECL